MAQPAVTIIAEGADLQCDKQTTTATIYDNTSSVSLTSKFEMT
jgi:hypothetical protein